MATHTDSRIPVTLLTGFLGAGKTTLLNRILTEQHGKKIAVIENEFGEVGIDNALVINADEEIFEMNNGCICCTVRGDLIRILGNLMRRRDKFDAILIETTGLADPAPVAQTFFVDEEIGAQLRLDGIITVVDAKHVHLHLEDSAEVKEQIAFADVILLNKADLVEEATLDALEQRMRAMNAVAKLQRTVDAQCDLSVILDIGSFDLSRALSIKPDFLVPEYPFEWAGLFHLPRGHCRVELNAGPDPTLRLAWLPLLDPAQEGLEELAERAVRLFAAVSNRLSDGSEALMEGLFELQIEGDCNRFDFCVERSGDYACFTQHRPDEFSARFSVDGAAVSALESRLWDAGHEHDDEVGSVGIEAAGTLDYARFESWIGSLLRERGADIYRSKGIVSVKGMEKKLVFHAVHMLIDMAQGAPWGDEPRCNQLVFIGRNLDRQALRAGFQACLA